MSKTRFKKLTWPIVNVVLLLVVACNQKSTPHPRLDVATSNQSAIELDKLNIRFGNHECDVGVLVTNALAVHMYFEQPVGDSAEVTWVEPTGVRRRKIVNLAGVYDKRKAGRLTFEIRKEDVRATFREFTNNGVLPK